LPKQYAAPAPTIQAFVNSAIGLQLPSHSCWGQVYLDDPECTTLCHLVENPGKICKETLKDFHYCYRQPLHQSQIVIKDNMLIYHKPIRASSSYTWLQIVSKALFNIVFVAFHSNPIGGHFNAYRTLHCLHLCCFWPEMYSYIKRCAKLVPAVHFLIQVVALCPNLSIAFPSKHHFGSSMWMHTVDAYKVGNHASFEGDAAYVIACCGMTGFAAIEPVKHATSQTFASAVIKIQLKFGLCHMIILDKDSKFFCAFKEVCNLLQLNCHVLSGGNHNPIMVEHVNHYLNKGLKVMTNKRGSVQIVMEAILLLIYVWNSAPILGTDLSRSFVALGWEFQFPIDFSADKHWELTSAPAMIKSYSKDLAAHLQVSHEITTILIKEQHA
jgi:hypothetical protein